GDRRDDETAGLNARGRHARPRRAGRNRAEDVRHLHDDAADLLGIDVRDHQPAVLPVEAPGIAPRRRIACAHGFTVDTVDTRPLRVSVKSCLYSPRLILCVTRLT